MTTAPAPVPDPLALGQELWAKTKPLVEVIADYRAHLVPDFDDVIDRIRASHQAIPGGGGTKNGWGVALLAALDPSLGTGNPFVPKDDLAKAKTLRDNTFKEPTERPACIDVVVDVDESFRSTGSKGDLWAEWIYRSGGGRSALVIGKDGVRAFYFRSGDWLAEQIAVRLEERKIECIRIQPVEASGPWKLLLEKDELAEVLQRWAIEAPKGTAARGLMPGDDVLLAESGDPHHPVALARLRDVQESHRTEGAVVLRFENLRRPLTEETSPEAAG
jgi:hypothetical protein